ncbi:SDR family NAD(P)-dependent oxidoreductase [Nocardia arthritidis]|uniref:3-oxoacyl-[acyl-carrier-protein] reductase MabA n=1 Tax=Nocardia arthritidis TaxID=228602 RepID=A0A6G9YLG9_9NOCA|nr:SDR family NAD(P)-dependent oxidoreductase [Nocardia arthritidis]QIS14031.1 SDR family NAD(P)-dependent oxidoreductase [Nocardia arthritidis]
MTVTAAPVRFDRDLADMFRQASADQNPLHIDEQYARGTAFGEPVVYGVLGALVALSGLDPQPARRLTSVSVRFPAPILFDRDYQRDVVEDSWGRAVVRLTDGPQTLLQVTATFGAGSAEDVVHGGADVPVRTEARRTDFADFAAGQQIPVAYAPRWAVLAKLLDELALPARGVGLAEAATLTGLSYLAGMEAPGSASLLAQVEATFEPGAVTSFRVEARVRAVHEQLRMLELDGTVTGAGIVATTTVKVFHRPDASTPDPRRLSDALPGDRPLAGRAALVIGASRGLGAAITQALALSGADVYAGYQHSHDEIRALVAALGPDGELVHPISGDAADPRWCAAAVDQINAGGRTLDHLVLNACPVPSKMALAPGSTHRTVEFVSRALALVHAPLAACAADITRSGGSVLTISTAWVTEPKRGWSGYVVAKKAVEGLITAAAEEYPGIRWLLARPDRLRTAFNATPMAAGLGAPVEPVAAALVAALGTGQQAGTIRVVGS